MWHKLAEWIRRLYFRLSQTLSCSGLCGWFVTLPGSTEVADWTAGGWSNWAPLSHANALPLSEMLYHTWHILRQYQLSEKEGFISSGPSPFLTRPLQTHSDTHAHSQSHTHFLTRGIQMELLTLVHADISTRHPERRIITVFSTVACPLK